MEDLLGSIGKIDRIHKRNGFEGNHMPQPESYSACGLTDIGFGNYKETRSVGWALIAIG